MTPDSDPPLPRPPDDPEHLRHLREQALQRVKEEEHASSTAPVYGGPPGSGVPPKRRWTRRGLVALIGAAIAAVIAWLLSRWFSAPVYGGPPPQPVYGGPPPNPAPSPPPDVVPPENPPPTPRHKHKNPPKPPPAAAVYGGPPR